MGVGWIDNIWNNTDSQWFLRSVDSSHNGAIQPDVGAQFVLDDGHFHAFNPRMHFHASWCGIPWYYQGSHFKAFSVNQSDNVQFYTSYVDGKNWIYYLDGLTGHILARTEAPQIDFHCNLRFEDSGPVIDIVNDDGSTQAVLNQLYTELKSWATIAASALGSLLKSKSGGGGAPTSITADSPSEVELAPAESGKEPVG
jgi:hypothetical protein